MLYFRFTRGDLISLDFTLTNSAGNPIDVTNLALTGGVRLRGFYAPFTITKGNAALGQCTITAIPSVTALWPVAILEAQIKADGGGNNVKRSEKFRLEIELEV